MRIQQPARSVECRAMSEADTTSNGARSNGAASGEKPKRGRIAAIVFMCAAVTVFAMVDASAKYLVDVLAVPVVQDRKSVV